ncbi:MAG: CopG family transcriptional regulator [Marinoscillum sp.]
MKTITIRVSDELNSKLKTASQESGFSQSEVVRNALEKHLRIQKFRRLRNEIIPLAESKGFITDDDIFNDPDLS